MRISICRYQKEWRTYGPRGILEIKEGFVWVEVGWVINETSNSMRSLQD